MIALRLAVALWLATTVHCRVSFTNSDFAGITIGKPFTITWSGRVTGSQEVLTLLSGSATNPVFVLTIATDLVAISYTWIPESTLQTNATYVIEINDGSGLSYSPQFTIAAGTAAGEGTSSSQTTSTPSPSSAPTISAQSTSDESLSSGAKAGIGVGVALGVILFIIIIWLVFRQRRKQREERMSKDTKNGGVNSLEKGPELMTSANTHEIDGKPAAASHSVEVEAHHPTKGKELDSQYLSAVTPVAELMEKIAARQAEELEAQEPQTAAELGLGDRAISRRALPQEMQTTSNANKMAGATNVGSAWQHFHPGELDSKAIDRPTSELSAPAAASITPSSAIAVMPQQIEAVAEQTIAPSDPLFTKTDPDQLRDLQKRMEQVRAEKQRLERIQQLEDVEAELQAEIMAEKKRRQATTSGS